MQMAYKGKSQVKESKVKILTAQYETFTLKVGESIQDMHMYMIHNHQ